MFLTLLLAITIGSQHAFSQAVTITLTPGWNWISYPNAIAMEVNEALATYTPLEGDMVKGAYSFAVYDQGSWIGGLTHFMPGRGYMYYSTRNEVTSFVFTQATSSIVATAQPADITDVSAVVGGVVTLPEGSHVFLRGVCWGTEPNPDIDGNHTSDGSGIGAFVSILEGLDIETTYHIRAYAVTDYGLAYGSDVTFTTGLVYTITATSNPEEGGEISGMGTYQEGTECTLTATPNEGYTFTNWTENGSVVSMNASYTFTVNGNRTLVANFETSVPVGAINGLFTINASGDQVYFSQGNLQYIGSASTPYYRFSDNQYDMLGAANQSSLDIDLLSTRFQYDWSDIVIENGGNESGIWHVLGMGEWIYLTMQRATSSGIPSTLAKVNNVDGLLVPPDDWDADLYPLSVNLSSSESNVISLDDWNTILEPSGVLFLPCAGGIRDLPSGNWGYWDGPGNYWASDGYYPDPPIQDCILFRDGVNSSVCTNNAHVYCRLSVRLVKNYNP